MDSANDVGSANVMQKELNLSRAFLAQEISYNQKFTLFGEDIIPFAQDHSSCITTGFRFSNFAYSTDVFELDEQAMSNLQNLDLWIVSCAKYSDTNANHAGFNKVINWINIIQPKRAILTHMGMDMDYDTISAKLPLNVELAYDGMEVYI
jgi:phosphoribosyl 1,2-cyclic phosphate phosphodiesterase